MFCWPTTVGLAGRFPTIPPVVEPSRPKHEPKGKAMKSIPAIKKFFEAEPHGRPVSMQEMKDLTVQERAELGELACAELGQEFEPTVPR